ncbi:hypothetical protein [Corticimicrobacter populi]|uniref:Uncharacterized protein n=1 Tax=Corticimicrobacter populi TaxID=2175229 RepID=A0A2V1K6C2_9BURK|nr:hypothetical protein [Corticimicrobacter populi]PWF25025.1 hypothetical protein DD235_02305 [Corticimicrobacter populi]
MITKKLTLDEWADLKRQELNDFSDDWAESQGENGTKDWPEKMSSDEWNEQLLSFVGATK